MYRITLTTQIQRIKDGTKTVWETVETSKKYITDEQHENLTNTDTLRFFKSVGYREYTEKSHTFAGYKITQLVSTNPNKSKRKIRSFEFEHLTLEQWHNWQVDEFSTYHPNQFPQGWEQWVIAECGSRDIERIAETLDELVTIFAESLNYEIFHVAEQTINSENEEVFCEGEGYYCWHCLPGCLPDNEAHYLGNEKRESLHMFMTYFVPLELEWDYESMSILDPVKVVTQDNSTTTKANKLQGVYKFNAIIQDIPPSIKERFPQWALDQTNGGRAITGIAYTKGFTKLWYTTHAEPQHANANYIEVL